MEPGRVLVVISNDDPGAIESSHETHHDNPRYVVNGVVHYCVSNIPGAVAYSTSVALAGDTLPLLLNILNNGLTEAACGWLYPPQPDGIQGPADPRGDQRHSGTAVDQAGGCARHCGAQA